MKDSDADPDIECHGLRSEMAIDRHISNRRRDVTYQHLNGDKVVICQYSEFNIDRTLRDTIQIEIPYHEK